MHYGAHFSWPKELSDEFETFVSEVFRLREGKGRGGRKLVISVILCRDSESENLIFN